MAAGDGEARVAVTGPKLSDAQVRALFPPNVTYRFLNGVRTIHATRLPQKLWKRTFDVPAAVATRCEAFVRSERCDVSFLLMSVKTQTSAMAYFTEGAWAAASDVVDALGSNGATWKRRALQKGDGPSVVYVLDAPACSQSNVKDLKGLHDVVRTLSVALFPKDAKLAVTASGFDLDKSDLAEVVGCDGASCPDFSTQQPSAKQALTFPRVEHGARQALVPDMPLGARLLSALATGDPPGPPFSGAFTSRESV